MRFQHIVVAADESSVSRTAIVTALHWGRQLGARVTVLHVGPLRPIPALAAASGAHGAPSEGDEALEDIRRWLEPELARHDGWRMPELASAAGVPSIEISRFAEDGGADLLVLGRKPRSKGARLLLGDTADAVARRSRLPCLFVSGPLELPRRVLVAIDGTERGYTVFHAGRTLTAALGCELSLVTVEPVRPGEPGDLATLMPSGRSVNLRASLNGSARALQIRRGDVVREILDELVARQADVLAIGYHRGGPPGLLEAGSVARRLLHLAPRAVLTVPL
jgi:nucleotide-binding universal stress UspA family protein